MQWCRPRGSPSIAAEAKIGADNDHVSHDKWADARANEKRCWLAPLRAFKRAAAVRLRAARLDIKLRAASFTLCGPAVIVVLIAKRMSSLGESSFKGLCLIGFPGGSDPLSMRSFA